MADEVLGCLTAACAPAVVVALIGAPFHWTSVGGVVEDERSFRHDRITKADAGGPPDSQLLTQHRRRLYSRRCRIRQALWQIAGAARPRADPGISTPPDQREGGIAFVLHTSRLRPPISLHQHPTSADR